MAIGIVKDGKLVYAKGYGVRSLGDNVPVTPDTRFGIASNSKAFTTTALSMLVEEGKLDWNERVITYMPWFRVSDPWVTREMRVRDLITHRSGLGLGGGDLMAWLSELPRDSIVRKIAGLPANSSFRSTYEYNNIMYAVAGELIPAVTGESWEAFVTRRIVQPLGMTRTVPTLAARGPNGNDASPHIDHDFAGKPEIVIPDSIDNIGPAASIQSTITDLAKWVAVQLDSGRVAGAASLWKPTTTRALLDHPDADTDQCPGPGMVAPLHQLRRLCTWLHREGVPRSEDGGAYGWTERDDHADRTLPGGTDRHHCADQQSGTDHRRPDLDARRRDARHHLDRLGGGVPDSADAFRKGRE